jgi:DNA-binding CsgD family transcriptional regulator
VIELYRAAPRLRAESFAAYAFSWLKARIPFERGVIVTSFKGASWVDAHFSGVPDPRALMESHAKAVHVDIFAQRMLANPFRAQRCGREDPEVADARFAPLREHMTRFGARYVLSISIPSTDEEALTSIMFVRESEGGRFTEAQAALLEAVAPHVAEAAAINRDHGLPRDAGLEVGALPAALLAADGRFLQTTPAFARLFWPGAPPDTSYLQEPILRALKKGQVWRLPGGRHTLYAHRDDAGGWLLRLRASGPLDQLSAREREIAALFARGVSHKGIAAALSVAPATARNHLQNLYAKLGVASRDALIKLLRAV